MRILLLSTIYYSLVHVQQQIIYKKKYKQIYKKIF